MSDLDEPFVLPDFSEWGDSIEENRFAAVLMLVKFLLEKTLPGEEDDLLEILENMDSERSTPATSPASSDSETSSSAVSPGSIASP